MIKKLLQKIKPAKILAGMSPNEDGPKKVRTTIVTVIFSGALALGLYFLLLAESTPKQAGFEKTPSNFARIADPTFSEEDNHSAITDQQVQINNLENKISDQSKSIEDLLRQLTQQNESHKKATASLEKKLLTENKNNTEAEGITKSDKPIATQQQPANSTGMLPSTLPNFNYQENFGTNARQSAAVVRQGRQIESFRVPKTDMAAPGYVRDYKNYIPVGSFCKAIVLGGADASAGVDAQGEASPMLFKVMENCYLPNGKRSDLKGAVITASVYGKISSERGMVRLEHISFVRKNGSILELPVEGTAFDIGGKNGLRGSPVMRNDKVIVNVGLSGVLAGLGSSAQQYSQTQSVSPLGQTTSIDAAKILPNALGSGASTAFGEISKYYIELAKQYSPIIQLNPGAMVDVVFLKGFPLQNEEAITAYESQLEKSRADKEEAKEGNTLHLPNLGNNPKADNPAAQHIKIPQSLEYQPANQSRNI